MRKTIRFDHPVGCYFAMWTGRVHAEDVISFFGEIVRHPEFRSGMNRLHDCRDAVFDLSQKEIDAIARSYAEARSAFGDGKVAVLVRADLSFDAARIFLTLADLKPGLMGVYRDLELARAWLGLPEGYESPLVSALPGDPEEPAPGSS